MAHDGSHHVSDGILFAKQAKQNGGCFKYITPFIFVTEYDLFMFVDEASSVNTKKQISYVVKRMKMFASRADVASIETMSATELDGFWPDFLPD